MSERVASASSAGPIRVGDKRRSRNRSFVVLREGEESDRPAVIDLCHRDDPLAINDAKPGEKAEAQILRRNMGEELHEQRFIVRSHGSDMELEPRPRHQAGRPFQRHRPDRQP
jgi:hypothetical protein